MLNLTLKDFLSSQEGSEIFKKLLNRPEISRQALYFFKQQYLGGDQRLMELLGNELMACYEEWLKFRAEVKIILDNVK